MTELIDAWPIIPALMAAGAVAGLLAGLLGIGGGIVIVPVLYFILPAFGVSAASAMTVATATSLAIIVPTAISSSRAHFKRGNVDFEILSYWGGFVLVSAVAGRLIASHISGHVLTIIFSVLSLYIAINMTFRANSAAMFSSLPGKVGQAVMASIVGGISVMIGIGGGTIAGPMMMACNVKPHRAVGTSSAFGLIIAVTGVLTLMVISRTPADAPFGTWHSINLPAFFVIIPLTILFAPLGAKLGAKLDPRQIKKVFALLMLITGTRMLVQALTG
jgi:uncharacterized membrane protein YfcA